MSINNIISDISNYPKELSDIYYSNITTNNLYIYGELNNKPISEYTISLENAGVTGPALLKEIQPREYQLRRLEAGSNISLIENSDNVNISAILSVGPTGPTGPAGGPTGPDGPIGPTGATGAGFNSNRYSIIDDFIVAPGQQVAFVSAQSSSVSLMTMFAVPLGLFSIIITGLTSATNANISYNILEGMNPLLTDVWGVLRMAYRGSLSAITASKWSCFQMGAFGKTNTSNVPRTLPNFLINSSTNISRVYKFYWQSTEILASDGTTVLSTINAYSDNYYTQFCISNISTFQKDFTLDINGPYKADMAYSIQFTLYQLSGVSYACIGVVNNSILTSMEDIPISVLLVNTVYYVKLEIISSNIIISFIDNVGVVILTRTYNINVLDNTLSYGFINAMSLYNVSDTEFMQPIVCFDYISTEIERTLIL